MSEQDLQKYEWDAVEVQSDQRWIAMWILPAGH